MDTGKLIGEVARRHQVMLGRDDPVLVMATVSEMAMEPTVERMEAIAREVQATVAQCAGLVREIRGAVPGITREVGDRFLDHHTHYTTAATRRTALIYTVIAPEEYVTAPAVSCALSMVASRAIHWRSNGIWRKRSAIS